PGRYNLRRLEKIASRQNVRRARCLPLPEYELRGTFRVLLPQLRDLVVCLLPFRNRGAPIAEDRLFLLRRALCRGNGKNFTNVLGQRISSCAGGICNRKSEPAEVVVLIVIAVPAPMILGEINRQQGAAGIRDRRVSQEN